MKHTIGSCTRVALAALVAGLFCWATPFLHAADIKFDSLRIGPEVYTNVTVLNATATDIFIQHAGGLSNFKVQNLDPQIHAQLTGQPVPVPSETPATASIQDQITSRINDQITSRINEQIANNPELQQALGDRWDPEALPQLPPLPEWFIPAMLGGLLLFYLFLCYCAKLIVQKTNHEPGFLIWLPGLQLFPVLRAAGMPGWWFFIMLIPVLNIIPSIVLCFKIVEARGKSLVWAVLLLLPIVNFLAFLYLAFSSAALPGGTTKDSEDFPLLRAA